jgi:hypothetical protein
MSKQENVFHIAFWTHDHPKEAGAIPPGWISALKVTIEVDALPPEQGDLAEKYNVALADHPLYKFLRKYAVANKDRS